MLLRGAQQGERNLIAESEEDAAVHDVLSGTLTYLVLLAAPVNEVGGRAAVWIGEALAPYEAAFMELVEKAGGVRIDERAEPALVCTAFRRTGDALSVACQVRRAVAQHAELAVLAQRLRMALDVGPDQSLGREQAESAFEGAAQLAAAANGGQLLLSQRAAAVAEHLLPPGAELRSLGSHRMRDLISVQQVFELSLADQAGAIYPPLRSMDHLPNNLPIQVSSFVGRQDDLAAVRHLLAETRLLTLTGPGGSGKTRLALHIGASLLDSFADGVWLIDLAPISDPNLIVQIVANTLGVANGVGRSDEQALADALRVRRLLLILDNCEHVTHPCGRLALSLLSTCPQVRILVTSREALGVAGEAVWPVPALSLPQPDALTAPDRLQMYGAIRLFLERARAVLPSFTVTEQNAEALVRLCRRLDGMPLAIELAAARVKVLSVEQIADRLHDRFRLLAHGSAAALPRQQTLRGTIDWSYELATERERILWQRLSVFAGSFLLEAAEGVCGDPAAPPGEVLDVLSQMVDKSVVAAEEYRGERRFRLLESIRQYGEERLRETGEEEVLRRRHRDWFLQLVRTAEGQLTGHERGAWLDRLEQEHDNLFQAQEWSLERGETAQALDLGAALERLGRSSDGARRVAGAGVGRSGGEPLTEREREIVRLAAEGLTTKEIGQRLYLSPRTVEKHEANIRAKLNLPNRAGMVAWAVRNGVARQATAQL